MVKILKVTTMFMLCCLSLKAQNNVNVQPAAVRYKWKNVQMVGGGFVDGVVFHPAEKGLRYCRTDIGGAYKWNDDLKRWEPLMDWVSYENKNLMGVESIAIDAANTDNVYLACGTYTSSKGPNAILSSNNRGKTFKQVNVPFRMGGNENGRGNGERLAVDPNDGNIIYMGTRLDGLWRSKDKAVTWSRVDSFPLTENNAQSGPGYHPRSNGIVFVLFDARSGSKGKGSAVIYAGISLKGQASIFSSEDNGISWQPVANQPIQLLPTRAVLTADGIIYIAYGSNAGPDKMVDGAIWKLNTNTGKWTDITPVKPDISQKKLFGYAAVAVDVNHPGIVIASTFNRYGNAGGEDIFRSIDGGENWKPIFTGTGVGYYDYAAAPYVKHTGIHWLFDIEIDPFNADHALFTTGYGGQETFNLTAADKGKPTKWQNMSKGIEETVSLDMASPPVGAPLISAIGDYGGFVHWNLDIPATQGNFINPRFSNTDAIAFAEKNPAILVRVGESANNAEGGSINLGYSTDGGKHWQPSASSPQPGSKRGAVSIAADGKAWLWSPQNSPVYYTNDCGTTWDIVKGLPNNTRVTADRVNPLKFYAVDVSNGLMSTSDNGGTVFNQLKLDIPRNRLLTNNALRDNRDGANRIYATPGMEGDIWLAAFNGLYHSTNGGFTFSKAGDVSSIHGFGFGKPMPGASFPALYIIAAVNGINGVYRSNDVAQSWARINDDNNQWGLLLNIAGDPKKYGRVYVGTHGRGILYGDPTGNN